VSSFPAYTGQALVSINIKSQPCHRQQLPLKLLLHIMININKQGE
jgi:hypothetical protein